MENAAVRPQVQWAGGLCRVQVEVMPRVYVHTEPQVVTSKATYNVTTGFSGNGAAYT